MEATVLVPIWGGESVSEESLSEESQIVVSGRGGGARFNEKIQFGCTGGSRELEEVDVGAEVEEEDLFVTRLVREECVLELVEDDGSSYRVNVVASLFDVRRAVEVDESFSAFRCGTYSPSEFFLFRFP
jgi:hypothetical protein